MTIQWHYTPARPSQSGAPAPSSRLCSVRAVRPAPLAPWPVLPDDPTDHTPPPWLQGSASGAMPPADTDSNDPIGSDMKIADDVTQLVGNTRWWVRTVAG